MNPKPKLQGELFDGLGFKVRRPAVKKKRPVRGKIQARFELFDREHPEVFAEIVRLATQVRARGFKRFSIRTIWERMRWTFFMKRGPDDEFKLNDHFHSRYARKLVADHPEFAGMYETRTLRS